MVPCVVVFIFSLSDAGPTHCLNLALDADVALFSVDGATTSCLSPSHTLFLVSVPLSLLPLICDPILEHTAGLIMKVRGFLGSA